MPVSIQSPAMAASAEAATQELKMINRAFATTKHVGRRADILGDICKLTVEEVTALATSPELDNCHRSIKAVVLGTYRRLVPRAQPDPYLTIGNFDGNTPEAFSNSVRQDAADGDHDSIIICDSGLIDDHFRDRLEGGEVWSNARNEFVSAEWYATYLNFRESEVKAREAWLSKLPKDEDGEVDPFYDDTDDHPCREAYAAYVKAWHERCNYVQSRDVL